MSRWKAIAFVALQGWLWKTLRWPARLRSEEMEAISPKGKPASREKGSKVPSGCQPKLRRMAIKRRKCAQFDSYFLHFEQG
jgi:hypothetical protein